MRVVLTGISGLGKELVLEKTRAIGETPNSNQSIADPDVSLNEPGTINLVFDLEHEMCLREKLMAPNYLDIPENELFGAKNRTLEKLLIESEGKKNVILAMHATYYRRSSLLSVLDWTKLEEFRPEIFITLIDDVYGIRDRIKNNPNAGPVKFISLKDIIWWREVEFLMTREIAKNISGNSIPHYLVALSQAPTIIFQLMFESYKKKVYASYPVTTAKTDSALGKETSDFLKRLKKHFIVFDPMAIGEKLLHDALIENLRSPHPEPFVRIARDDEQPQNYEVNDILSVISDINGQIVSRDQRLVMQSDMIIGYRPTKSPGAQHELRYAKNTGRIETFVVHPSTDPQSPFVSELADQIFTSIDQLLEGLREKGYIKERTPKL
jgi:adenylate kinase